MVICPFYPISNSNSIFITKNLSDAKVCIIRQYPVVYPNNKVSQSATLVVYRPCFCFLSPPPWNNSLKISLKQRVKSFSPKQNCPQKFYAQPLGTIQNPNQPFSVRTSAEYRTASSQLQWISIPYTCTLCYEESK